MIAELFTKHLHPISQLCDRPLMIALEKTQMKSQVVDALSQTVQICIARFAFGDFPRAPGLSCCLQAVANRT